jgi:hypothetical protein
MQFGISGGPLPAGLPFGDVIEQVSDALNFSPILAYDGPSDPPTVVSDDGGHGLFQLTSSYPSDWAEPVPNTTYAIEHFLEPALTFWSGQGYEGDPLIKLVAAEFNSGRSNTVAGHEQGDCDLYTTHNYGARCVAGYHELLARKNAT